MVAGHRSERRLSNVAVSRTMASFPGLVYMARVRGSWCRRFACSRVVEASLFAEVGE